MYKDVIEKPQLGPGLLRFLNKDLFISNLESLFYFTQNIIQSRQ